MRSWRLEEQPSDGKPLAADSEDFRVESLQRVPNEIARNREDFSWLMPERGEGWLRGNRELRESGRRRPDLKSAEVKHRANRGERKFNAESGRRRVE